jgi:hypothetical protein
MSFYDYVEGICGQQLPKQSTYSECGNNGSIDSIDFVVSGEDYHLSQVRPADKELKPIVMLLRGKDTADILILKEIDDRYTLGSFFIDVMKQVIQDNVAFPRE